MKARGFVMQASYRIRGDATVVHLHGRLEDGRTFLVRDARQTPCFYVRAADAARAREGGATRQRATRRRTFAGEPVTCIEVRTPPDAPPLRDRLQERGIETFEADVRFAVRYLIDRDVKGGVAIDGDPRPGDAAGIRGVDWVFDDPELGPADVDIAPRVLSFDIETDPKASRLLAISLYGCGVDEVHIVDAQGRAMPEHAVAAEDEHAALEAFCRRVAETDPDILTGWNVVDFDLSVLGRIAARVKHPFLLGREPGALRVRAAQGYFGSGQASVPGRVVLDGMDLVRGAFVRMDEYSLDAVARSVLGEGKAVEGDVRDRAGEIMERYANDLPGFRPLRPRGRAAGARDRGGTEARSARPGAQPPDGNDAGPGGRQHRLVRLRLSRGTRQAGDRGALGALERRPGVRRPGRRARPRTRHRHARQRLGVRLQEPVPECDAHLQHGPAGVRGRPAPGRRGRSAPRAARRSGAKRPSCPACSTASRRRGKRPSATATRWRRRPSRS